MIVCRTAQMYDTQMAASIVKSLRMPPELWTAVESAALAANKSPNAFAVEILQQAMAPKPAENVYRRSGDEAIPVEPASRAPKKAPGFKSRLKGEWKAP